MARSGTSPDSRVNSDPNADPYEDDGEPWDCDRGFPDEADDGDEDDERSPDEG